MKQKTLLFIFILLSNLTANAYDAYIDGIYYNLIPKGKIAEVTYGDTKYTGSITIPGTVKYNDVTYSVTSIGNYAFQDCSKLTSVTIPYGVTSIGMDAFSQCYGLTEVNITDIAAWCNIYFSGIKSNPLYFANHLYMDGKEIKELLIPNSVTSIGNHAFSYCKGLTSVTIPNSVTEIGSEAFCATLEKVEWILL